MRSSRGAFGMHREWTGVLVLLALVACTYGPPRRTQHVSGVLDDSARASVVILQAYHIHRPPTGLAAFPDGGVARTIEEGIEVLRCDRASGRVTLLARILREPGIRSEFSATPVRWLGDTLVVRVHGSTGTETGQGEVRIRYVGVLPDGSIRQVAAMPPESAPARGDGPCRAAVDSLYREAIRVSAPR